MDNSITRQIEGLTALRKNIESLEQDLRNELTYKPEKLLDDLEAMGFPRDLASTFRINYMAVDNEKVNNIIRFIDYSMLQYIDNQISILRSMGLDNTGYNGF